MRMLKMTLKTYMANRIMMKEKEKDNYLQEKKLISLMKPEEFVKIVTKLRTTQNENICLYSTKKYHKIKDSEFEKVKVVTKSASKELTIYYFDNVIMI